MSLSREYVRRIVDDELDALVRALPAVSLEGPRGIGKTATALQRAGSVHRLDDPGEQAVIDGDPHRLVTGDRPVLIDEWQRLPQSWDVVRRAVDSDSRPGQYLLTGSATPLDQPTHSGAARIVTIRMWPLTLSERGVGSPTVSIAELLTGRMPPVDGTTDVRLESYVDEIVASGFPAFRGLPRRAVSWSNARTSGSWLWR